MGPESAQSGSLPRKGVGSVGKKIIPQFVYGMPVDEIPDTMLKSIKISQMGIGKFL